MMITFSKVHYSYVDLQEKICPTVKLELLPQKFFQFMSPPKQAFEKSIS